MGLNIARKGWVGAAFESSPGDPATIDDYLPHNGFTLFGMSEKIEDEASRGVRERVYNSVQGKKFSEGDLEINVDATFVGYPLIGALGSVSSANVAGSVYDHTITRNNSNTPQTLTLTNDRAGIDRQYFPYVAVKTFQLSVADGLASATASLMGRFPVTTTSGSLTTASGSVFAFPDVHFAFGNSVAAAASAANLKPSDLSLTIENNTVVTHRHGSNDADSIDHGEFEVNGSGTIFFEDTTNRDRYYDSSKQAAALVLSGVGIGGGYSSNLTVNLYRLRLDTYELETGLADFYAERFDFVAEYDDANDKSIDAVLRNVKSSYGI